MTLKLGELYQSKSFTFACSFAGDVNLIALWYLSTDQGADGQLFAMSDKVICDRARGCAALSQGKCALTAGYGEVLNARKVLVLEDVEPVTIVFKGNNLWTAPQRNLDRGQHIWFGRTGVYESMHDAQA
jgi:hypothetical protein